MDYPFAVNRRGRIATTSKDDHIRELIYQVLFTRPGERVNRCRTLAVVWLRSCSSPTVMPSPRQRSCR